MNKVILIGRLTREPEVGRTSTDLQYVRFSVAIDRNYRNSNGEKQTDFINCVAWRQTADLIARYVHKGHLVGIEGQIQTNTYDDNQTGKRLTSTTVLVEQIQFLEKRETQNVDPFAAINSPQPSYNNQGYNKPVNNYQGGYNNNQNYNNYNNNYNNGLNSRPEPKQENPFENVAPQYDDSSDDFPF